MRGGRRAIDVSTQQSTAIRAYAATGFGIEVSSANTALAASGSTGVRGTGTGTGVVGISGTVSGIGVFASASGDTGVGLKASSPWIGIQVDGRTRAIDATNHGIGIVVNAQSTGTAVPIWGSTSNAVYGLYGSNLSSSTRAYGLYARGPYGAYGRSMITNGYGVFANGRLGATSTKSFLHPHPGDPKKVVQFICLEGNEAGTYFRGKTRLAGRRAEIPIPKEWQQVTDADPENISVQLTAIGSSARLWVENATRDRITVRGTSDCRFYYTVNGVREGFVEYKPYEENLTFVPEVRGIPFGKEYPESYRKLLVKNGILNADFTPNEDTARENGWKLVSPESVPALERHWLPAEERARLYKQEQLRERTQPLPTTSQASTRNDKSKRAEDVR